MYEIYAKLRDARGLSDYRVSKDTGIGRTTLADMKQGRYKPSLETLHRLAEYFDVSVEYLETGRDTQKISEEGTEYHFTDRAAAIAQEVSENRDLLLILESARNVSHKNLQLVAEMLRRLKEEETR